MKIAVINKKGGVGKTPFAFSIAKDLNMYLQSNDNSCIEEIYPEMAKVSDEVVDIEIVYMILADLWLVVLRILSNNVIVL